MKHSSLRFDHAAIPIHDAQSAHDLFANVLGLPLLAAHEGDNWDGAPWLMMIFGLHNDGQIALCARRGTKKPRRAVTDLPHYALTAKNVTELKAWKKKTPRSRLRDSS